MKSSKEHMVFVVLVLCVVIVAFWEIMSNRSRNPFRVFQLTAVDFQGFAPVSSYWHVRPYSVPADPIEPNILTYSVTSPGEEGAGFQGIGKSGQNQFWVRLVHGYNMQDCMKIKGYKVALIRTIHCMSSNETANLPADGNPGNGNKGIHQVWKLTSSVGDVSIWMTSMLRTGDFNVTDVDVRSMAFPRIGIPDDPGWLPRGMTLKSLRHPIRSFQKLLRTKWNNARCDPAVFLMLKQPAWASDELLTLVTALNNLRAGENEDKITGEVIAVHNFILSELQRWREERVF